MPPTPLFFDYYIQKREEKREETREAKLWESRKNSSPLRGSERVYPLGLPPTYPVSRLPLSRKRRSWEHGLRLRFPFPPACRGKGNHGNMACACDSLSPLPVEETTIMGTRRALAKRFSLCLTRKRQSWGACDSLFPLPVEEKDFRGTLQGSVAGVRTEFCRALKGSAKLCRASGAAG